MHTPPIPPAEKEPVSRPPYSDTLVELLTDIAYQEKQLLAAETTIATLTDMLAKKEKLDAKDLPELTQLSAAHDTGHLAKKTIGRRVDQLNAFTPEPLRKVLQQAPLTMTVVGYTFTLSAVPNSVNAWMLDLVLEYPRS